MASQDIYENSVVYLFLLKKSPECAELFSKTNEVIDLPPDFPGLEDLIQIALTNEVSSELQFLNKDKDCDRDCRLVRRRSRSGSRGRSGGPKRSRSRSRDRRRSHSRKRRDGASVPGGRRSEGRIPRRRKKSMEIPAPDFEHISTHHKDLRSYPARKVVQDSSSDFSSESDEKSAKRNASKKGGTHKATTNIGKKKSSSSDSDSSAEAKTPAAQFPIQKQGVVTSTRESFSDSSEDEKSTKVVSALSKPTPSPKQNENVSKEEISEEKNHHVPDIEIIDVRTKPSPEVITVKDSPENTPASKQNKNVSKKETSSSNSYSEDKSVKVKSSRPIQNRKTSIRNTEGISNSDDYDSNSEDEKGIKVSLAKKTCTPMNSEAKPSPSKGFKGMPSKCQSYANKGMPSSDNLDDSRSDSDKLANKSQVKAKPVAATKNLMNQAVADEKSQQTTSLEINRLLEAIENLVPQCSPEGQETFSEVVKSELLKVQDDLSYAIPHHFHKKKRTQRLAQYSFSRRLTSSNTVNSTVERIIDLVPYLTEEEEEEFMEKVQNSLDEMLRAKDKVTRDTAERENLEKQIDN